MLTKANPLSHNIEKCRDNQKKQILKKSINDLYVAENYYKGMSDESILHEKDGTISKLMQFDYKVHKIIKNN